MLKIDLIDRKILYELDHNARLPLTQMAKKLRISRETLNYRIKNLEKEGVITKYVAQIDPTKLGYSVFKLFFKFQNLSREKEKELLDWLINNPYIYWVASSKGKWDLNITVFARNISHLDEILSGFINKFGSFIAEQEFNTTLKVGILSKNWLMESKKERELRSFGAESKDLNLDQIDVEILRLLANNARMNVLEMAKKIKSTARIVAYRIKDLEKKRIILGYSISVDYEKLSKQFFKANIFFNVLDRNTKKKIEEYCKSRPNIIYFIFCVGSWPLEIEFLVKDNSEFYQEMDLFREQFPEMKGHETLIFPKEYKFEWMPACYGIDNVRLTN
ncbi:MAG: Lrp/AsnC family transcriptional regulator [Nanoarchaeota archaeon]